MKNSIIKNKNTYFILGILFIFVLWSIGSSIYNNNYILPNVGEMFKSLFKLISTGHTYKVLGHTLIRLITAIIICFTLSISLAFLSYLSEKIGSFLRPLIILFKSLPIAVIIILLLVMFKKELAVYYITSVVVLPIMYEATLTGLKNIDDNVLNDVRLVTSVTPKVFFKIHFRLALPNIIMGLIQSVGLGLKVLVMAEYISQPKYSIGNEMVYYKDIAMEMSYVYAWSIILVSFILFVEIIINKISKKVSFV